MSRIDLLPAHTTVTGVSEREMRSEEMSKPDKGEGQRCAPSSLLAGALTRLGSAVDPSDPSSRKDLDASEVRHCHRARDRRSAVHPLLELGVSLLASLDDVEGSP